MIYVLHFERPYHHARHYVGYAERDVARRVHEHLTSTGRRPSPLVRAVVAAGIEVTLAAIIVGDRALERRIKDHAHAAAREDARAACATKGDSTVTRTMHAVISKQLAGNGQTHRYVEVLRTERHRLRVTIQRDAIVNQSRAVVEVFDPGALCWNAVHAIPPELMQTKHVGYAVSPPTDATYKADRDELLRVATEVLP